MLVFSFIIGLMPSNRQRVLQQQQQQQQQSIRRRDLQSSNGDILPLFEEKLHAAVRTEPQAYPSSSSTTTRLSQHQLLLAPVEPRRLVKQQTEPQQSLLQTTKEAPHQESQSLQQDKAQEKKKKKKELLDRKYLYEYHENEHGGFDTPLTTGLEQNDGNDGEEDSDEPSFADAVATFAKRAAESSRSAPKAVLTTTTTTDTTTTTTTAATTATTLSLPVVHNAPESTTDSGRMPYRLPASAADWCMPPKEAPLPYASCQDTSVVNSIPLYGGLTNALKMLLLGTILSFENDQCFFVDESESQLALRNDPNNAFYPTSSFLERYFEPIGIKPDNGLVEEARRTDRVQVRDWREVWEFRHNRRIEGQYDDIESLRYHRMEGHLLKRVMLQRMWRPLPYVRAQTCRRLEHESLSLQNDFMAFSIRQGDKQTEHFGFATMIQYIHAAERAVMQHFGGRVPTIFVATDDCSVLVELRQLRPSWTFVSECRSKGGGDGGFRLGSMLDWTVAETDEHFGKFFVELYAMAISKYFIGVTYTNISWFVYFMRQDRNKDAFEILETPGSENRESLDLW